MLFACRCPGCGAAPASRRVLCDRCREQLRPPVGAGLAGAAGSELETFRAVFAYDEHLGRILLAGKNGGRRDVLHFLARALELALEPLFERGEIDMVTWVPASRGRARRRGYDQGEELARSVARRRALPHGRLLARAGGDSQANRSRNERLVGPKLRSVGAAPARVLLVDDVATTGASLASAAAVLRSSGATSIHGAVVALADGGDRLY